jgi:CRP-like cAMP-binding protein
MAQPADAKLIAESVLGKDLTREDCDQLSEIVTHKTLSKDQTLFDAGDRDETLYILTQGKVELTKDMGMGKQLNIATLKPGAMIGEMAFIDAEPHSLTATALMDSSFLLINKTDFENFVQTQPLLTYHVMRAIIRYVHTIQRKLSEQVLDMHRMVQNEYTAQY